MTRLLCILQDTILDEDAITALSREAGALTIDCVDSSQEALAELQGGRYSAVMVPYGGEADRLTLESVHAAWTSIPIICVLADGDYRAAAEVAGYQTLEYVFAAQLSAPHGADMLSASVERAVALLRQQLLQQELEGRNSELLGINALANAVSSSLNHDVIIRRALWVFGGLCRRGAAALVQIHPPPPLPDPYGEIGEIGEVGDEDDGEAQRSLRCAGEFAVDGQPVCGEDFHTSQWIDRIVDDEIVVLGNARRQEVPAGIEPLMDRLGDGVVTLVPIWGQGRALGMLVLSDLAAGSRAPFTREALRAMASQLGGALENARLFQEIDSAYRTLQKTQDQLLHAEKFAAMGVLAAEIAHEINNPASFVISNMSVMVDYVETIGAFLERIRGQLDEHAPQLLPTWSELAEEHEIAFLREDLEKLLTRSLGGMQRIHQIVQDLRFFSHDTANEPGWIDIESLLQATLNLIKHEARYRAELVLDFDGVPQIFSDANRLSQVFLNLLVNAVHAIDAGSIDDNRVVVRTEQHGDEIVVSVSDTGEGIPLDVLPHIFDPFFTTKPPGEGTGLGLSISRDIARSLGGDITVESAPGVGSTFRVALPVRAPRFERDTNLRDSGSFASQPAGSEESSEGANSDDGTQR
jgi:signal transduction histidine kinase